MPRQPFHLTDSSPWPFSAALSALILTVGLTTWFHTHNSTCLILGLTMMGLTMFQWWRDVIREGTYQGYHTSSVVAGLRWGMILFITSEVLFFLAFFWAFFHSSLAPTPELGCSWPPTGTTVINPFSIPLLNTAVLLASGVTVTWAHHSLMAQNHNNAMFALGLTVTLGGYFTILQAMEYYEAPFTIADSIYGTTFYVATGFHGLHVLIGSALLLMCFFRLIMNQFSSIHHFGFEASAWYWHFVDVVWIFLFLSIYWWGA